ncbi:MAG: TRAP transporter large permease [Clostridia bacterium]|nr:TRAP transporter large permease [Clostridia bacterium]
MVSLVLFGSFALFLILNLPIGIALGLSSVAAIYYSGSINVNYLYTSLVSSSDSFPLMAVPFFILAGELMGKGGISKRLLNVANMLVGRYTGGLALVTIAACMFFAAISGSGPATVAAIGGLVYPTMIKMGYDKKFSAALIATAGSIGVMIPPSIPMVIYSISTENSISELFLAGFLPGILVGLGLMIWAYIYSKKKGYHGTQEKFVLKDFLKTVYDAKWALIVPVIILGGIYGGVFTPTEAAAVAVAYGFIVGVYVYKDLKLKEVYSVLKATVLTTGSVMIILGTASAFGRILTIEKIPVMIANAITSVSTNQFVILLLINTLLLIIGCFMETIAAIIILSPILLPIVVQVGVDPIHFGIIMVVALAIGFITPPLGINLFVACGISEISLEEISKGIIPWLIVMISILLLLSFIPQISLLLPNIF